jgi:hypothetical protein
MPNNVKEKFIKKFNEKLPGYRILDLGLTSGPLTFTDGKGNIYYKSMASKLFNNKNIKFYSLVQNKEKYIQQKIDEKHLNAKLVKIQGNHLIVEDKFQFKHKILRNDFLKGFKLSVESSLNPAKYLIFKANKVHNNFYEYLDFKYKNGKSKFNIKCPYHGVFKQQIEIHLRGGGCPECGNMGWGLSEWLNKCKNPISTLYIVKIFDGEEEFVKVGITNKNIKDRFKYLKDYNYISLFELKGNNKEIWKLEKNYLHLLGKFRYNPKKKFIGYTECFDKKVLTEKIIINGFKK